MAFARELLWNHTGDYYVFARNRNRYYFAIITAFVLEIIMHLRYNSNHILHLNYYDTYTAIQYRYYEFTSQSNSTFKLNYRDFWNVISHRNFMSLLPLLKPFFIWELLWFLHLNYYGICAWITMKSYWRLLCICAAIIHRYFLSLALLLKQLSYSNWIRIATQLYSTIYEFTPQTRNAFTLQLLCHLQQNYCVFSASIIMMFMPRLLRLLCGKSLCLCRIIQINFAPQ
jgi:hypothetical protein